MAIRIPTAREFARQPYEERRRLVDELHRVLVEWADTEKP